MSLNEEQIEEFREAFALFDHSGNGLDITTLGPALRLLGIERDPDEVKSMFNKCLSNNKPNNPINQLSHEVEDLSGQSTDQSVTQSVSFEQFVVMITDSIIRPTILDHADLALVAETLTIADAETVTNSLLDRSIDLSELHDIMAELELGGKPNGQETLIAQSSKLTAEDASAMIKAASTDVLTHAIEAIQTIDGKELKLLKSISEEFVD